MEPRTVNGNANLNAQQDTLNFTENTASVKTVSYEMATPASSHLNLATFDDVTQTEILPALTLVEVSNGQPEVPDGQEVVFVSDVWVSGVVKKVAGIR